MPAWPYCLLQQQCSFGGLQLKLLDAPWQRLIRRTTNLFFAGREKKQPRREKRRGWVGRDVKHRGNRRRSHDSRLFFTRR
jgi:hypothetical protein